MINPSLTAFRRFAHWWEDRANPLLVRTLRQEMRSRAFILVYQLALLAGTLAAVVLCWWPQDNSTNQTGGELMFAITAIAWSLVSWSVVPITMAQSMIREASEDSWYLLELTGLRPPRILFGYVQSALARGLWIGCALLPFLGLSYLLRGVELWTIVAAIVLIPIGSCVIAAWATFLVSLGVNSPRLRQGILGLVSIAVVMLGLSAIPLWTQGIPELISALIWSADMWPTLIGLAVVLNIAVVALLIPLVLAAAQLTHHAENRSTSPRLLAWVLVLMLIAWPWLGAGLTYAAGAIGANDFWEITLIIHGLFSIFATAVWAFLGLFATTEGMQLSQRQQRSLRGGRFRRYAMWALGPGGDRGRRCVITMGIMLASLNVILFTIDPGISHGYTRDESSTMLVMALLLMCQVFVWLAIGDILFRCLPLSTLMRRVVLITIAALWTGGFPIIQLMINNGRSAEGLLIWWSPGGAYMLAEALIRDSAKGSDAAAGHVAAQPFFGFLAMLYLAVSSLQLSVSKMLSVTSPATKKRLATARAPGSPPADKQGGGVD